MKVKWSHVILNDLIDEHNKKTSYSQCKGCDKCKEIEKVSKEIGLWIGENDLTREQKKKNEAIEAGRRRSRMLTKEKMAEYIKSGLTNEQISKEVGITKKVVGQKIREWFPDLNRRKRKIDIGLTLEIYQDLRKQGLSRADIAKKYGVTTVYIDNCMKALRRERESGDERRGAMC